LKLIDFIKKNKNWETKLQEKPYCLTIRRKNKYILFMYSQIDSDFSNSLVKECRGIILKDETFKVVCFPFTKFFNIQESHAVKVNWNTARVQEKLDGSIIKLWFDNQWNISTNGTIDASEAGLGSIIDERYKTYYDLFIEAVNKNNLDINQLNKDCTYIFELVSPFNRVVIPYTDIEIYHTGTKNNITYEELNVDIGIKKPKEYSFNSLEDVVSIAETLPYNEEGYVIVDDDWNRVKIKSPAYVAIHHLKNNGIVSKSRIVTLIRKGEQEEFLSYFPEYKEYFDDINKKISIFIEDMNWCIECAKQDKKLDNRKRFAEFAKTTKCPPLMFNWLDGKILNAKDWLFDRPEDKVVEWIGA